MDGTRFDDLLRAASARGSRRGTLRTLVAAAVGIVAGALAEDGHSGATQAQPGWG